MNPAAPDKPAMTISETVQAIPDAISISINQMIYDLKRGGYDPTVLSLGEAFFELPLFDFNRTDIEKGFHYSDSQGIPELRQKIAAFYNRQYGTSVDGNSELLITAGSKPAVFMAMMAILEPGDEVLIPEPCWLSYPHQATLCHAASRFIPYDVEPGHFGAFITEKTRLLIMNNPNNPRGRLYNRSELAHIYNTCRERGIYVMVDEAYSDFVINEQFHSMAGVANDKSGVIVINSLSKNMGMSGWRIGYLISNPEFVQAVLKINQHLITCAPTILLQYCARYFDDILDVTLPQVHAVVEKRQRVARMMDELGISYLDGGSTFYFFVSIGNFPGTSEQFASYLLLKKLISVVQGSAYGSSTDRFIRLSIGAETEERIWEALQVIKTVIDDPAFEPIGLNEVRLGFNLNP